MENTAAEAGLGHLSIRGATPAQLPICLTHDEQGAPFGLATRARQARFSY
jgi:hypothetical protein